ncbi:MAG: DNA methyltransferase, partial [Vicinamibacterales bacterium]
MHVSRRPRGSSRVCGRTGTARAGSRARRGRVTSRCNRPLRRAVEPSKQGARRHYGSHPYFTKRAWNVVQEYIRHFSEPGHTVLDPFGGSGVTAVESLVLRRRAIYADISAWACFLARQTARAPVDVAELRNAYEHLEARCRAYIERLWRTPTAELEERPVADWYPSRIALPSNSDVRWVEELFTPRMLHGLAHLRAAITDLESDSTRDLMLMAFSATLARINRTFLSARNRLQSRGGSAIFSIYRYKVAKEPVELPLWEQFSKRFAKLVDAKRETNELIGDFYRPDETAVFRHASATRLLDWLEPESIDYIYTDPPYG